MKYTIYVLIVLCGLFFAYKEPKTLIAEDVVPDIYLSIPQLLEKYGGKETKNLQKVIKCESGGNPKAVNYNDGKKGSHSYGLMQFKIPTWERFSKLYGQKLDINSGLDQVKLGAFIFNNYPQYKTHWSCSKKTGVIK